MQVLQTHGEVSLSHPLIPMSGTLPLEEGVSSESYANTQPMESRHAPGLLFAILPVIR